MNRRTVSGAAFIGLFCMYLPIPFQMVVAGVLAIASRCNLPMSIALVWISNPLTMGPMFYFAYRLGAWLLDRPLEVGSFEPSFSWLVDNAGALGYPLLFGCLVCGWVAGLTGFVVMRVIWRMHVVRRWRERRAARRKIKSGEARLQD